MELENRIIDYISDSDLKSGLVVKQQNDKLQVQDPNRRQDRVRAKQIFVVHSAPASDWEGGAFLARLQAAADDVDTELLWEATHEAATDYELPQLAQAYFDAADPTSQGAVLRAVMADSLRFKRKGLAFSPRSIEDIENLRTAQQREAERAAMQERVQSFLQSLFSTRGDLLIPPELEDFMGQVEAYMYQDHQNDAARLLAAAHSRREPRDIGLELLERAGRLPADADPFLLLNGVSSGFSAAVEAHAAAITPFDPATATGRLDYRGHETIAIDDPGTREVDDALTIELEGDRLILGIHIADPEVFVKKGDPIDRVAADRPLTLYLPTTTVIMMPEHVGCDLASLNAGVDRPSLSFRVVFGPDDQIAEPPTFARAMIRVTRHLSYEEADAMLEDPQDDLARRLQRLQTITAALRAARTANGAFLLSRPEQKVTVRDGEVTLKAYDQNTPSRQVISETMILANRLAAEYALSHDVPIIYRTQDPPPEPLPEMPEYDAHIFDKSVRLLKRSRLSTEPLPHAGLGLDVYTQISSPIRRYADLVMQRQLAAHLAGEPCPYEGPELVEVLGAADQVETQNKRLERESTKYWIFEYVRRHHIGDSFPAIAVNDGRGGVLIEILPYCIRGRLAGVSGASVKPGDRLTVSVAAIDPQHGTISLKPVEPTPTG